jgi:hypothetical protein
MAVVAEELKQIAFRVSSGPTSTMAWNSLSLVQICSPTAQFKDGNKKMLMSRFRYQTRCFGKFMLKVSLPFQFFQLPCLGPRSQLLRPRPKPRSLICCLGPSTEPHRFPQHDCQTAPPGPRNRTSHCGRHCDCPRWLEIFIKLIVANHIGGAGSLTNVVLISPLKSDLQIMIFRNHTQELLQ